MKKITILLFLLFSVNLSAQKKDTLPIPKWKIQGRFAFIFNQSSFSNWASGGENTIAGNINVNYDFNYKTEGLIWDNKLIAAYGLTKLKGQDATKSDDRFEFTSLLGKKAKGYWLYSGFLNFKTQMDSGFDVASGTKISHFFSPAKIFHRCS